MRKMEYLNFELRIGGGEGREYPVSVLHSPAGEASGVFVLPFSDEELGYIKMVIELAMLRSRERTRQAVSLELEEIEAFGAKLFDALFHGPVRSCYDDSLRMALGQGKGLRIKLRIEPPELVRLPWEFIYSKDERKFLVLSTKTPLVRYTELVYPSEPLVVEYPLRILVMVSCPRDYPPLDVEGERRRLNEALGRLEGVGVVEVDFLEGATLPSLQDRLRGVEFHVLHFIGHGGYDEEHDEGVLVLEGKRGEGERVRGSYLGRLLGDHLSMRLVVLNACETGRASLVDPFGGVAASLVDAGIPAVVAMQFGISDEAAVIFAREFYAAITDSYPVDAAVAEGRKAIDYSIKNTVEWGTPVLYMRAPDGVIFQVRPKSLMEAQDERLARLYDRAKGAMAGGRWGAAVEVLGQVVAIDSNYRDASRLLAEARDRLGREERLGELYDEGVSALARGDWGRAVTLFGEVVAIDSGYKHAAANLAEARRQERIASLKGSRLLWPAIGSLVLVVMVVLSIYFGGWSGGWLIATPTLTPTPTSTPWPTDIVSPTPLPVVVSPTGLVTGTAVPVTPTAVATNTPTPTPMPTYTHTPTPRPRKRATSTPTATPIPPTDTPVPPTPAPRPPTPTSAPTPRPTRPLTPTPDD